MFLSLHNVYMPFVLFDLLYLLMFFVLFYMLNVLHLLLKKIAE